MANVKISELPNATTPLGGSEAVPIVQSGATVQAPASAFGPSLPLAVASGGTGLTSGTSGGVPYFSASGTITSSGVLTLNRIVLGGGAGGTPTVTASLGTSTTVLHGNASGAPTFGAVALTTDVTGTLPIANGGTGQITANAALNALLPNQSGHSGEFLTTNGTNTSWAAAGGGSTKFAYAEIDSTGGITRSSGVTSVNHIGTGAFLIDITAAAFSGTPTLCANPSSSGAIAVGARVTAISATSVRVDLVDGFGGQADSDLSFIAIGT